MYITGVPFPRTDIEPAEPSISGICIIASVALPIFERGLPDIDTFRPRAVGLVYFLCAVTTTSSRSLFISKESRESCACIPEDTAIREVMISMILSIYKRFLVSAAKLEQTVITVYISSRTIM